jgi:hypothetical protein
MARVVSTAIVSVPAPDPKVIAADVKADLTRLSIKFPHGRASCDYQLSDARELRH